MPELIRTATQLRELMATTPPGRACACALGACAGWESITEERWPAEQMEAAGTLRDPDLYEPTYDELHPDGTRYDSPTAPIALKHFPFNRCDVWHCQRCDKHLLRYTEYGGYYIDHRVRTLATELIVGDD